MKRTLVLLTFAFATAAPTLAQQTVPPPITSETPAQNQPTTTGAPAQDPTLPAAAAPLTKKQLKQQRQQQKHAEKAANQSAQAQKDQANALKHQDQATQEQEKLTPPK